MSGLGNVLTGFIGGAAGGIVAIGGVKRLREKRDAVRRRKETPDTASEEPAHTGSTDLAGRRGATPASGESQYMLASIAARLADAETNLAAAAKALGDQEARLVGFEARFDRVLGKAAKNPGTAPERDEAVVAFAAFLREIDETGFDPEAKDATGEQRVAHRAARDAADRAEHWLGRTGEKDRARQIHTAVGEGRKALIRLDALRRGRPVPLAHLDQAELAGFVDAAAAPYTEDRFRWEGRAAGEFLLDRPVPGRPVLVEVRRKSGKTTMRVIQNEKTDRTVRQVEADFMGTDDLSHHLMVKPETTHLALDGGTPWTVTVVDVQQVPKTGVPLSGRGGAVFRHRGRSKVTVQGTGSAAFRFYPDCKCGGDGCKVYDHIAGTPIATFNGPFRQDLTLPGGRGTIVMRAQAGVLWSLDPITDR